VNVSVTPSGISIELVILDTPTIPRDSIVVRGVNADEDVTLSLTDLLQMTPLSGFSSFQNQYDNWRGQGIYEGIAVSTLLELVGGMTVNDTLVVMAYDGYYQEFSYSNVYPNASWTDIQGPMILAYSYNGTRVLDWTDGMRLVMLPSDGAYSNEDANLTSSSLVLSAGSRWVRFVSYLEVVPR
jgi:hypothetical protein